MNLSSRARLLPLAAALTLGSIAFAQQQPIIDRAGQGTPTPAAPAPVSAPTSRTPGVDEDAGVQRVAETRKLPLRLSASLDAQLYTTSNVFLAPDDSPDSDEDAVILASTLFLRAEGLPAAVGRGLLTPSVGFAYQRYLHGIGDNDPSIESLDFDSFSLPIGLSYRFGRGWEASAGFTIGSLYSVRGEPSYELLYRSHVGSLGLRKITEIARDTLLVAGAGISYSDTWTSLRDVPAFAGYRDDRNDRFDYALDAALYHFLGAWTFSTNARLSYADYLHWQEGGFDDEGRRDLTLSLGLSASYAFTTWGSARVFAGYDLRDSSLDGSGGGPDHTYDAGALGLGVTLSLRY